MAGIQSVAVGFGHAVYHGNPTALKNFREKTGNVSSMTVSLPGATIAQIAKHSGRKLVFLPSESKDAVHIDRHPLSTALSKLPVINWWAPGVLHERSRSQDRQVEFFITAPSYLTPLGKPMWIAYQKWRIQHYTWTIDRRIPTLEAEIQKAKRRATYKKTEGFVLYSHDKYGLGIDWGVLVNRLGNIPAAIGALLQPNIAKMERKRDALKEWAEGFPERFAKRLTIL